MLSERRSSPSPSPSRRISIGNRISAIGARLGRRSSIADDSYNQNEGKDSISPILSRTKNDTERSISRGREAFTSTGRGGIGNIRYASQSRDARSELGAGPDDFSPTRGREVVNSNPSQIFSTGRGGAGNLRSPSRDPTIVDPVEQEVIKEYAASRENSVYSSGRGGIGNMNRSRSRDPSSASTVDRSRSRDPAQLHPFGRGGAGNIHPHKIDENEGRHFSADQSGRGGAANITLAAIENHANSFTQSTSIA